MRRMSYPVIATLLATTLSGCGTITTSVPESPTTPTTTASGNSYAVFGKLPAAVNGVLQNRTHTFVMPAAGTVTLTLASAIETLLDGTALSTVTLGVGLGKVTNGVCTLIPGAYITTASSTGAQMAWTMPQGTDCVKLSDVTNQEGPVAYVVLLTY